MKPHPTNRFFRSLSILCVLAMSHGAAHAAAVVKASTGTSVTDAASWDGGVLPTADDVATWTTGSLGGTLTFGSTSSPVWKGIEIESATTAITLGTGGTNPLTLGSSGIKLASGGVNLTLSSPRTFGTTSPVVVESGRTLSLSGSTTTFGAGTTTTISGGGVFEVAGSNHAISGSGNLVVNGASLYNNLQSGGSSTGYSGATTLDSGIIRISTSINMFGTGAINLNGGAIGSFNTTGRDLGTANAVNIGGNIQIGGSGVLSTGYVRFGGATDLGNSVREINAVATSVFSDVGAGAIFTGIVSNGGITKTGGGILTLTGFNTYAGATTVNAGSLAISQNALASSASLTLANSGTALYLGQNGAGTHTINNLSGVSGTSIRSDFTISGTNTTRSLTINQTADGEFAGTFVMGSSRAFEIVKTGAATLTLSGAGGHTLGTTISGGTLRIGGAGLLGGATYAGAIANSATLHFDSSASQSLTGTLTGSGTLLKSGTGALTISGTATGFGGNTTVSDGILTLNSAIGGNLSATGGRLLLNSAITGNVTAGAGSTFGGTGGSTGDLDMTDGSTLLLAGGATVTGMLFDGVSFGGTVYLEFASSPIEATVYDVVGYGSGGRSGFASLTPLARGTLTDDTANGKITFTAGAPATRTWNIGSGTWNRFGILQNWAEGDKIFYQGDDVVFGNITEDATVTLDGLLAPSIVKVQNAANTYTFAGTGGLSGNGDFEKPGAGTLVIGNPNSNFTGLTLIDAGVFRIIDGGTWGTGNIVTDGTVQIDQSSNLTLPGAISGTGNLAKSGSGTLRLTVTNSYGGATTLNAGILQAGANNAFGAGTLTINGGIVSSDSGTTRTLANSLALNTNPTFGDGANGGQLVFDGAVDLLGAVRTITSVLGTQGVRFNGVISNGGITKAGTGRITLANDTNTFTGATTINEGILATSTGALANSASVTIASGAELAIGSNGTTVINNLNGVDGSLIVSNFNIATDGARTLEINQTVDGEFAGGNTQGANRVISLIKSGAATLRLSGSPTYTGTTTVKGGILAVSGSLGNTAVTVETGATLAGNGNIGGSVTIQADAIHSLAVAATPGAQTTRVITGPLTLDSGNILALTAAAAPADGTYILATAAGGITGTPTVVNLPSGVTGTVAVNGNNLELTVGSADYATWAATYPGFSDTDPAHDPDGDGLTNFEEYAFGLDPTKGSGVSAVTAPDKTAGTFTYTRRKLALTGLGYSYWSSTSLGGWDPITPVSESTNNGDPVETITVTLPSALLAEPNLFLRVKAANP